MTQRLGLALTAHHWTLDEIIAVAKDAEALGYEVMYVDGDATVVPRRPNAPIHDPSVVCATVLAATTRLRVAAIRFAIHHHPAALARAWLTLDAMSGGRAVPLLGVGTEREAVRIGLPVRTPGQRVSHLAEMAQVTRALMRGESVSFDGEYMHLDEVVLSPVPKSAPSLVVSAAGPRALGVVARFADVWDANVPPLPERLSAARETLGREMETWCWVFARPGAPRAETVAAFRRHVPWFGRLPDDEAERCVIAGDAPRERLDEFARSLGVQLIVLDLAGLTATDARDALAACAPAKGP